MRSRKTDNIYRLEAEMLWMRIILRAVERLKYGMPQTTGLSWNSSELIVYTE